MRPRHGPGGSGGLDAAWWTSAVQAPTAGWALAAAALLVAAVLVWPVGARRARLRSTLAAGSPTRRPGRVVVRWVRSLLPPPHPEAPLLNRRLLVGTAVLLAVVASLGGTDGASHAVGLAASPVVAGVTVVVLGRLEPAAARRRRVQMVLDLPQVLELMSVALEAGRPLRLATSAVAEVVQGPLGADLRAVVRAADLGRAEDDVWRSLRHHPVLGPVAVDLARSVSSGTRLVELLRQHGRMARRLRHGELEAMAKAVGVRCVLPLTACFLPAFVLVGVVPIVGSVLAATFG